MTGCRPFPTVFERPWSGTTPRRNAKFNNKCRSLTGTLTKGESLALSTINLYSHVVFTRKRMTTVIFPAARHSTFRLTGALD